jgi:hypothetical protein
MKNLLLFSALFLISFANAQDLPSNIPTDGLVAYYPFNGNANDESGNGNHGTTTDATLAYDRFDNENSAYSFDGDGDYIVSTSNVGVGQTTLTFSFWAKTGYGSKRMAALSQDCGEDCDNAFGLVLNKFLNSAVVCDDGHMGTSPQSFGYAQPSHYATVRTTTANSGWNNYVLIVGADGDYSFNNFRFYVNGIEQITNCDHNWGNSQWQFNFPDYPLMIGNKPNSIEGYFHGEIDDVAIWNRALSNQEVYNLYDLPADILLDGVVSAENHQIKNVADPVDAQDAVTKSYVDALMTRIKDLETKINPSVQTTEVFVMSETEVNCGGNAVNIGISDLLSKGVVWSESPNPIISLSSKTNEGNNASDFSSIITGLQKNRVYYVRAYLETSNGVVYGNERTFITHMDSGQEYQGGYVFYIFQPNDQGYVEGEVHGLIAAKEIIDPGFTWTSGDVTGFKSIGITRAEDRLNNGDINSGISNCEKALTHLIENSLDGLFPAISQATSFQAEGFTDWYLPSYGQLIKLRQNLVETSFIPVPDGYFWSSSLMDNALGAMSYNLNSGGACGCAYFRTFEYILPIRTF